MITDKKDFGGGSGLLFLDIISSSNDDYDPREESDYYYCVLKGEKAEVLEHRMNLMAIGDTLEVDGLKKTVRLWREGKLVSKWELYITTFKPYYDKVKRFHKL